MVALLLVTLAAADATGLAERFHYDLAFLVHRRVRDEAHLLTFADRRMLEANLQMVDDESGAEIRFVIVPTLAGEDIAAFGLRTARDWGLGRESARRGLLFVYVRDAQRLRMEVGPALEGIVTDAFAGYLMREHARSFVGTGHESIGFQTMVAMVQMRLREAALGRDYDPRVLEFVRESERLAVGGGASAGMQVDSATAFLNSDKPSDQAVRERYSAQPTPQAAYARFLEWLGAGTFATDVELFTAASRDYLPHFPMTRAFMAAKLSAEYGEPYRVDERGAVALLYFTQNPLVPPHFLRKTRAGWQMDVMAEIVNVRRFGGWWYTWGLQESGDDFARAFPDRYLPVDETIRIAGGDNRRLPGKRFPEIALAKAIGPADTVVNLTVEEAAGRIAAASGRTLVLLYDTQSIESDGSEADLVALATACREAGASVLAFEVSEGGHELWELPGRLVARSAPFRAEHLIRSPGQLTRAMAPLGIEVATWWEIPIAAVRKPGGQVLQAEGMARVAAAKNQLLTACGAPV